MKLKCDKYQEDLVERQGNHLKNNHWDSKKWQIIFIK